MKRKTARICGAKAIKTAIKCGNNKTVSEKKRERKSQMSLTK